MKSLGSRYRALVIGASGSIGHALCQTLQNDPACMDVATLSRSDDPSFSLESEASIEQAAKRLAAVGPFELIIDATGALTIDGHGPEKHLGALSHDRLMRSFEINAVGPALILKHFHPLLVSGRAIFAKLSARVGSISDNRKGGWYGYRASKAALNMMLQTAAIELQRRKPDVLVVALQPGTVQSSLSAPFSKGHDTITPEVSASGLLDTLDALKPITGAHFVDYKGQPISW